MGKLYDLQLEATEWADRNFPGAKPYQPLLGAVEELGELAHSHLKMEQGIRVGENHLLKKKDAVGDIIIYLLHYCSLNKINIEEALYDTWHDVKKRDWTNNKVDGRK